MDYRVYRMNLQEKLRCSLEAAGLVGVIALCFYDSGWVFLGYIFFLPWYLKRKGLSLAEKRRESLKRQFRDMTEALAAALAAGYSLENALHEAEKDLEPQGKQNQEVTEELSAMQRRLAANQTVEAVFFEFSRRSGIEEAQTFAEVVAAAKRSGGDMIKIMKDTAGTIGEAMETQRQVQAVLASRKYEQKVMRMMPFAMLLYLRLCSPGFLDPLYHNVFGILAASGCLALYVLGWYLGGRLLEIEV